MAVRIVEVLCPAGQPITIDIDDTLFHKTGRCINGAGTFRDALRSTRSSVVYATGLNVCVVTVRVAPPWGGEPLGLPVNARLYRKQPDRTLNDLAAEMVAELAGWLPDRSFALACDGAYAPLARRALPRTQVTSRMRRNAAIYDLAPPPTGKRGRPRTKGDRLPVPPDLAAAVTDWTRVEIDVRGRTRTRLLWSRTLLWYGVCGKQPVLAVIVRDPDGHEDDDFFFTTDTRADPAWIASHYAGRWSIEDTFRNTKQFLGGEDPQSWRHHGPERATALSLWLSAAVWLWYIPTHGTTRTWTPTPWYARKTTPSFLDALAALRRCLWAQRITTLSSPAPVHAKTTGDFADSLLEVLAQAA
ncbi:MAG: transposase [Actinobacteria bacterium]|nr:transposase [Actinomycetota bacterium]